MITISLCMIVRDEELTLERCLTGIKGIVDEIIIVDTGSVDRTKEIAAKFTTKIYDFTWIDDFAAARNYSFSMAQMDYILWLDADDVILEEDRQLLMELKQEIPLFFDVVMMKYNVGRDEKGMRPTLFTGNGWLTEVPVSNGAIRFMSVLSSTAIFFILKSALRIVKSAVQATET